MSLSRLKASAHTMAVRKFTDRATPIQAFENSLDAYLEGRCPLHVLTFYGVGGIGKTRLLDHLLHTTRARVDAQPQLRSVQVIWLGLDGLQFAGFADCLLALRNQMSLDSLPFDYALLRYWSHEHLTLEDLRRQKLSKDSILFDIAMEVESITDIVVPAKILKRLVDFGTNAFRERYGRHKETLARIAETAESDLARHLPYYLGLAMEDAGQRAGARFVVFLDGYDSMLRRMQREAVQMEPDEWLRELIGASENGLFVVSSREFLRWAEGDPAWGAVLEQHILDYLNDADSNYFLQSIPITEPNVRTAITKTARGVPLYLDLCASIYLIEKSRGLDPQPSDFTLAEDEVIRRFLSHLDPEHAQAVRAMAVLDHFHYGLFRDVLKRLNIAVPMTVFADFCEASYAICCDPALELYKIHDNIRAHVAEGMDAQSIAEIVMALLSHGEAAQEYPDAVRTGRDFVQVCRILADQRLELQGLALQQFLTTGLWLIEAGQWSAVYSGVDSRFGWNAVVSTSVAAHFLSGLCARRRGRLDEARLTFARLLPDADSLGPARDAFLFHQAHVGHLLGNYSDAERTYRSIVARRGTGQDPQRIGLRSRRQLADVLLLRGLFREAIEMLETLEAEVMDDPLWLAETLRFRGHVLRFNQEWPTAEAVYNRCLMLAQHARSAAMIAKAKTNLAETLCWTAPRQASELALEAVELNREVENLIEVGKSFSAWAIASIQIPGEIEDAQRRAQEALRTHQSIGYQGGRSGARLALGLVAVELGDIEEARFQLGGMEQESAATGVYDFLRLPLLIALGDSEKASAMRDRHEWLNFDRSVALLRQRRASESAESPP